ncbi:unnamed protein product, partial [Ectocarpus sp. 6 AP-2014]
RPAWGTAVLTNTTELSIRQSRGSCTSGPPSTSYKVVGVTMFRMVWCSRGSKKTGLRRPHLWKWTTCVCCSHPPATEMPSCLVPV